MKNLKFLCLAAFAAFAFAACTPEGPEVTPSELSGNTVAILNNGAWGANNASVSIYDLDSKHLTPGVFFAANKMSLGDLGQDMLVDGDNVYIAVNGSKTIFVTDRRFKIRCQITAQVGDMLLSPRYLTKGGDKIYVTYYEGYLGEINPSEGYIIRTTAVGPNPEGVAYAGGKIYVANSGGYLPGYNNTVSVVDAQSFTETSTITVNVNPAAVIASKDGAYVYVSSFGDYFMIPSKLEAIKVADGSVSDCGYESVSAVAYGKDDRIYVLCGGYDEAWNPLPGTIYTHDAASNGKLGRFTDTSIPNAYSISADVNSGYVFAGSSDYVNTGDMYVFDAQGSLVATFDTEGINPQKGQSL